MPENVAHVAVDPATLAEAYERWLKAYREYDSSRQIALCYSCFRGGMISTLHLFPHHSERLPWGSSHRSVASAMFHDWFSVGGDLWAAYLAATIDVHGAPATVPEGSKEPESAGVTR
jgi:hypothetical protein